MSEGKRVLVTGASSGIGLAAATALARAGHTVFATARRGDRLEDLESRQSRVRGYVMDVTDETAVQAVVDRVVQDHGGIDVVINNAGYATIGPVEAVSADEVRRQFETNVFGLLNVTRTVLPVLRAGGGGRVVNISSVVGRTTFPGTGVYSASKFAVEALSDALRAEVRAQGVDVVLIEPGFVSTEIGSQPVQLEGGHALYRDFTQATQTYMGREIAAGSDAEVLARLIVRVVEAGRPKTRYLFPGKSKILVGMFSRTPDRVADTMKLKAMGAPSKG